MDSTSPARAVQRRRLQPRKGTLYHNTVHGRDDDLGDNVSVTGAALPALPPEPVAPARKDVAPWLCSRPTVSTAARQRMFATLLKSNAAFAATRDILRPEELASVLGLVPHATLLALAGRAYDRTGRLPSIAWLKSHYESEATTNPTTEIDSEEMDEFFDWLPDAPAESGEVEAALCDARLLAHEIVARLASDRLKVVSDGSNLFYTVAVTEALEDLHQRAKAVDAVGSGDHVCTLDLDARLPPLAPVVIDGLLRIGEVCNLVAAPKTGKSWSAMALAIAAAAGRPWLGRTVEQSRVLVIDLELNEATIRHRLRRIADAMNVTQADIGGRIRFLAWRGKGKTMAHVVAAVRSGNYDLVIIDPLYPLLPPGVSEIDDQGIRAIYTQLLQLAQQMDTAIVAVHHSAKGTTVDRATTDVGSGSGVMSRAVDTHLVLRVDPDHDQIVLANSVTRTFAPLPRLRLSRMAEDCPALRIADAQDEQYQQSLAQQAQQFAWACARSKPEHKNLIIGRATTQYTDPTTHELVSQRKANLLFLEAISAGWIERRPGHRANSPLYCREASTDEQRRAQDAGQIPPDAPDPQVRRHGYLRAPREARTTVRGKSRESR